MKAELPGTVKFIFQPAEEGPPPGEEGGASLMVKEGVLQNPRPQAIFGLHAMSEMAVGDVGYSEGPALAGSGHLGSEDCRQAGARRAARAVDRSDRHRGEFAMALQTIRSRTLAGQRARCRDDWHHPRRAAAQHHSRPTSR